MVSQGLAEVIEDRHGADQGNRWVATAKSRQNLSGIVERPTLAAISRRNGAFEKSAFVNGTNACPGKLSAAVGIRRGLCDDPHSCVKQGLIMGHGFEAF